MIIQRWNYHTHDYEPYKPDPSWKIVLFTKDMEENINCTYCGLEMTYGQCFTSKELHTHVGLGYPVCEECYEEELARFKKYV